MSKNAHAKIRQEELLHMWPAAKRLLRRQLSEENHKRWIEPLWASTFERGEVVLHAEDPFVIEWVGEHYRKDLEQVLEGLLGVQIKVKLMRSTRLPEVHESKRPYPNALSRSALFGVVKRGRRRFMDKELLVSWGENELHYTGKQLNQSDLDVWLQVLQLCKGEALGMRVKFRSADFLRALGRSLSKQSYKALEDSLDRLTFGGLHVKTGRYRYAGTLIHSYIKDEETGEHVVSINPTLAELFDHNEFSRLDFKQRLELGQNEFAKWLHAYVHSHSTQERDHKIGLGKLQELCGSQTEEPRKFRQQVRQAMKKLQVQGVVTHFDCGKTFLSFARGSYPVVKNASLSPGENGTMSQ